MYENVKKQTTRESGIELLKIFAMFIIVMTHVTQTLTTLTPQLLVSEGGVAYRCF